MDSTEYVTLPHLFRFVQPELLESQESGGLFFCMYCPFMEVIQQDSFIKFTPRITGFPPDKFTAGLTRINWTNRTAHGLPNKSLAHNKNWKRVLGYNIPTQHNKLNPWATKPLLHPVYLTNLFPNQGASRSNQIYRLWTTKLLATSSASTHHSPITTILGHGASQRKNGPNDTFVVWPPGKYFFCCFVLTDSFFNYVMIDF